ncbi:MAG: DUF4974 domain-containing protein [Cyclobacteriaceae bacterium]|nr:DUF4974 domain-containing protein [Cyclobacteriaceae bacterium]
MDNKDLDILLVRYFSNSISEAERVQVDQWRASSKINQQTFEAIGKFWESDDLTTELVSLESNKDMIWKKASTEKDSGAVYFKHFLKVAATFLLLFTAGVAYFFVDFGKKSEQVVATSSEMIQKYVEPGTKKRIVLTDGSVVFLNSDTRIEYPMEFSPTKREIFLSGEAFFEVAHDEQRPFIVHTKNTATTALGTSFNISSHENTEETIALLTGKIKVEVPGIESELLLAPGEMAVWNVGQKELEQKVITDFGIMAWKEGVLVFRSSSFDDFIQKIHRWYAVEIDIEGQPPHDWVLSAEYENETLENILMNLQFQKPFNYELKNKSLTLKFDAMAKKDN